MPRINHLFLRGTVWTWRRRIPALSTKTAHLQLSLRTKSMPVARIIANRLNFESDRVIQELTFGRLTKIECKAFLDAVIREERARIERVRLVSQMDPTEGDDQVDQRHDRLTAEAWRMMEQRGIDVRLTQDDVSRLAATGADPNLYDDLSDRIDLLARSIISESGTTRMIAQARQIIDHAVGADNSLSKIVTAFDILKLRKILISGKAVAWNETLLISTQN